MPVIAQSLDEALAPIIDGCMLAVPRESSGVPMAATRALIRRGIRRLHLVTLPTSTLQADLLIGAGCVETLETSAVSLGEFGPAPRFTAAILAGTIRMMDATCPALHAQFQAAEKGVPFMPLRGLLGSDVLAHRLDWKVVDNPFGHSRITIRSCSCRRSSPMSLCFMRRWRTSQGNVFIGTQRELVTMAHAAAKTIVTVEKIHDGDLSARSVARGRHIARLLCRSGRGRAARRMAAAAARPLRHRRRAHGRIRTTRRDGRGLCGIS